MFKYLKSVFSFILIMPIFWANAQTDLQTLPLNLAQAEKIFLEKNFALLAAKYNVDAQKALVLQSKLYPNPNVNFSTAIYNTAAKKYFPTPFTNIGEAQAGISQMILLAGKRNKQIQMARANAQLSEYQFFDLIRTLKYTLRSDFFNIFYLQQS